MITQLQPTQVKGLKEDYEDLEKLSKNTRGNKLPRSQAVAVFYFENHSVRNVRLITGSLLSSTGKPTFSPTLFPHAHSSPQPSCRGILRMD